MSRFRMFFFNSRLGHLVESGTTIGVFGSDQQAAITMAQRIWEGLSVDEAALGYSLLDTRSGRVCYTEVASYAVELRVGS